MRTSIFRSYAWPFIQWFTLMIVAALFLDFLLHRIQQVWIGRYLGPIGTLLILGSLIYSLRKRRVIQQGSPAAFLNWHEYVSWIGTVLVLVHAGIHFNALLPWLATFMMVIVVASGLTGKFLLKKANQSYKEKLQYLLSQGISKEEAERRLFFDTLTVDVMKQWRVIHLPITLIFGVLSLIHILSILYFHP